MPNQNFSHPIQFKASESLSLPVKQTPIPIHHYLRQPQRLVKAIADPKLMEQLSDNDFRLKMRPLNFMEMYHFQPTVILGVWSNSQGTVFLRSQDCEIRGIDYINDRFSLTLKGKLCPQEKEGKTYLQGQANLTVEVDLPPALRLTPDSLLKMTGNGLLRGVLNRIKQRLLNQLAQDYHHWVESQSQSLKNEEVSRFGEPCPES
ncbi:unknown [Crocosphaera subtropica ATCC 51142]|uniref:DUF1997 domain-containing protein n=1 Tax=Crocosphaera subtropica (strain ATCC 51142 / BH68) TaxID=43989 RepID=B1X0K4_CROS5|nr:DUF1997 domain-containing protein [Crocosphaera subtropica]ACB51293.1 unknown [Crocosphaera subtropica ATCC 51142]